MAVWILSNVCYIQRGGGGGVSVGVLTRSRTVPPEIS